MTDCTTCLLTTQSISKDVWQRLYNPCLLATSQSINNPFLKRYDQQCTICLLATSQSTNNPSLKRYAEDCTTSVTFVPVKEQPIRKVVIKTYGELSLSWDITCPRLKRLLLMKPPSTSRVPVAPVLLAFSDPARSTKFWNMKVSFAKNEENHNHKNNCYNCTSSKM